MPPIDAPIRGSPGFRRDLCQGGGYLQAQAQARSGALEAILRLDWERDQVSYPRKRTSRNRHASAHYLLSRPYFTPIHLQPFYRERFGYREGDFPVTESVARSTLALPFSGVMTEEQVGYVCENLMAVLRR